MTLPRSLHSGPLSALLRRDEKPATAAALMPVCEVGLDSGVFLLIGGGEGGEVGVLRGGPRGADGYCVDSRRECISLVLIDVKCGG